MLQAKEDAEELLQQKAQLTKEKQALLDSAAQKDAALKSKVKTIGNIVHDSVSPLLPEYSPSSCLIANLLVYCMLMANPTT